MVTPHELMLVLEYQALKLEAFLPKKLAHSPTIQAVLQDLSEDEFEQVKNVHTFAEMMDKVGEIKVKRYAGV